MDNPRESRSPEVADGVLSPNSPYFRRSSILTPCRRVGLSRKSRFSVPFSPVRSSSEAAALLNTTPVKCDATTAEGARKQRRSGSVVIGKCNFKSPSSNPAEKIFSAGTLENSKKQKLMINSSKNLAVTAFSDCQSANRQSSQSKTTIRISAVTGDCKRIECDTDNFANKEKTENIRNYAFDSETQPSKDPVAINDCTDKVKCVDYEISLEHISETRDDILYPALTRVKEKQNMLLDMKQKYKRKQELVSELQELTGRWLAGGQVAAEDLLARYKDTDASATMVQLLAGLGVPPSVLHYDPDNDEFQ